MERMDMPVEHETETKPTVMYLGSLRDLGLGNPEGIPSDLADVSAPEREAVGERLLEAVEDVTDFAHYGCIDGRNCKCNADGSAPEVRNRQVGGTGLAVEVAMNGNAPIMDTVRDMPSQEADEDGRMTLKQIIRIVEDDYEAKTGVRTSAHMGGCGGLNGAIKHNQNIARNEAPVKVATTIMQIPQFLEISGIPFRPELELDQKVRANAAITAQLLSENGWKGQDYVDDAVKREPAGVEELETAEDKFHGHKERGLAIVVSRSGKKTLSEQKLTELGLGEWFVMNGNTSIDMARAMSGQRGQEGEEQALIANLAKHASVADDLPSDKTPVYILFVD